MKLANKNIFTKLPAIIFINLITALRPFFGPAGCCKYKPSCMTYAKQALRTQSVHKACWLILKRVLSCW